jgi:hypothetical protein
VTATGNETVTADEGITSSGWKNKHHVTDDTSRIAEEKLNRPESISHTVINHFGH